MSNETLEVNNQIRIKVILKSFHAFILNFSCLNSFELLYLPYNRIQEKGIAWASQVNRIGIYISDNRAPFT